MINARRSRIEGLESLVRLQESFDDWQGRNLVADSSLLIHQVGGEYRIVAQSFVLAKNDGFLLRNSPFLPLLPSSPLSFIRLAQGDVWRVSPDTGWVKQLYLFLFDKQVIYCKKELLKNRYIYKGRIKLDEVTNLRRVKSTRRLALYDTVRLSIPPLSVLCFALPNENLC